MDVVYLERIISRQLYGIVWIVEQDRASKKALVIPIAIGIARGQLAGRENYAQSNAHLVTDRYKCGLRLEGDTFGWFLDRAIQRVLFQECWSMDSSLA